MLFMLVPVNAFAYIGPGMGLGAIGVVVGILLSIILVLVAILWYPFKNLLKKMKGKKTAASDPRTDSDPS